MNNKLFYIDEDKKYAVLLGYIMPLTKTEFLVLNAINSSIGYIDNASLANIVFAGKKLTTGNVSVHVCNINKKAMSISGRKLICVCRYKGYKISEEI